MSKEKYIDETNPFQRFDAFVGEVKNGGLRSVSSIKLLVSYIVASLNGKVTADCIIQAVDRKLIANHFEISDAIDKLIKAGIIIEAEDGALSLKRNDPDLVEIIERDLPLSVRTEVIQTCQNIIAKETYKRENKTEITKLEKGYNVYLSITDGTTDYLTLNMFSPTFEHAQTIEDKFITNPVQVYNTLVNAIFKNKI